MDEQQQVSGGNDQSPFPQSYEETPPLQPAESSSPYEQPYVQPDMTPAEPAPTARTSPNIPAILITLILLFALGFYLSGFVRQYFTTTKKTTQQQGTEGKTTPSADIEAVVSPGQTTSKTATSSAPVSTWKPYSIINGATRAPISGVMLRLPPDVLPLVCDDAKCSSQGTYLPGGTRFTVAPRGVGQILPDFRGKIISDVIGKEFTVKPTTVKGKTATEFTGSFTGNTVSGYSFTRMRGYMIELTPDTSLEINHFSPNGITTDFAADDTLFEKIISGLELSGTIILQTSISPAASPTAGSLQR